LQQQYTPPTLTGISQSQTQYEYNLDKQLIQIRRPDGQTVDLVYDSVKKRLNRLQLPNFESIRYTYDDSTGQLLALTAPSGSTLSYTYDGSLPLSETWGNGDITGTFSLSYNNDFQVTSTSLNGSHTVNYQYDNDGLLTSVGDLSLTRNQQNGLLEATRLGNIYSQRTHNTFGEMASETASLNGNPLYRTEYQRDKLGQITQKVETIEGVTTTYNYHYDLAGRLVSVKQDDVVVEAYTYDDNGNRLSANTKSGSVIGNYDDQDRLTQYGNATYIYTENGELRRKDENGQVTEYNYDVLGNLRSVQLPNGNKIEYVIDARNRRIGKKVNGVLTQAFLYQGSLNPIAEFDGDGKMVSQFVYGSKGNVPDYMLKGGKTYRILSNHLGSPKLVVDISDGSVVQRMDYDAFGNVTLDSNPGFQPFGFAGGIYDLDTQLTQFGARDYDAEIGRWTAKDPILFAGGDTNLYGYVLGDPVNFVDLYGLETGVITNGPTSGNPFGHSAIVFSDSDAGVYSFGNNGMGMSISDYVRREAMRRTTAITIIHTSPEQEKLMRDYLEGLKDKPLQIWPDNCANRTSSALNEGGLRYPWSMFPTTSWPGDVLGMAEFWRQIIGGETVTILRGSTHVPERLLSFEP